MQAAADELLLAQRMMQDREYRIRKRDELRMMLSSADITAVERAIDEHAGHPDADLQQLRRQLIQHREVSE